MKRGPEAPGGKRVEQLRIEQEVETEKETVITETAAQKEKQVQEVVVVTKEAASSGETGIRFRESTDIQAEYIEDESY